MIPIFTGKVDKGKLILENKEGFTKHYRTFEGKEIELVVRLKRKRITTPELRYYFGVIIKILANEWGYTSDEMDTILKFKFLKRTDERGLTVIPSKTELSTVQSEEFFEQIRVWALNDFGIVIPLPNQVELNENYQ